MMIKTMKSMRLKQVSSVIELVSPWLNRQFLSYVSELSRPYEIGMGLRLTRLSDHGVELILPERWRNRDERGDLHAGAMVTAAEHAGQLFWERHLDSTYSQFELIHLDANILRRSNQSLRARLEMQEGERERILFEVRRLGEFEAPLSVHMFTPSEQLAAEITTTWRLRHLPVLQSSGKV